MRHGFIYAVYLGTDDYGMGFIIPDAPWLNGRLQEVLEGILDQPRQLTPSTNPEEKHHTRRLYRNFAGNMFTSA